MTFLWYAAATIVLLGVLITIHEFGHFYVARKCGVKIKRFSIGFGTPIWRTTDKYGTEFVVSWIPLGGYVSMLSSKEDKIRAEDLPDCFEEKPMWQRFWIIAAGPLANFLLAVVLYWLIFMMGRLTLLPVIGEVLPESPAAIAQIKPNSHILSIQSTPVIDWNDAQSELLKYIGDSSVTLALMDKENDRRYSAVLDLKDVKMVGHQPNLLNEVGIQRFVPESKLSIHQVVERGPAQIAGIRAGDRLVSVDNIPLENVKQAVMLIRSKPGKTVLIGFQRDGVIQKLPVILASVEVNDKKYGQVGIHFEQEPWPDGYIFERQYGWFDSIGAAFEETWKTTVLMVTTIGKLLTGEISVKALSGPITIAKGAGYNASFGLVAFLSFMALISVNLAVINLLPLPVLDGGQIFMMGVELFKGKPVSDKVQEIWRNMGAILVIFLMGLAIFNDLTRL
ncbi:RIP metalloprotease RseP [Algicola sagamiensis]|uniref:RIP metalloprotease RseP n=1 Tax=Algicola sagamiensis TaxID=163869 RepID=UPI000375FE81|nr:RIP metalloprotease RseP [Algicola sagamiensis]